MKKKFLVMAGIPGLALVFGFVLMGCATLNELKPRQWREPVPEDQQCVLYYYSRSGTSFLQIMSIDGNTNYPAASALFPEACILPAGSHAVTFETGTNSGGASYRGSFTWAFESGQTYSLVCDAGGWPIYFINGVKEKAADRIGTSLIAF